jgi:hypothetical protein
MQHHQFRRCCLRKVKIIKDYYDTTRNKELVKAGTVLTVSAERGQVLIEAGVAKEIIEKPKTKSKK